MPRVAAITGKSDVAAQHHDVVDHVLKVFGNIRGPFSVLLHSPKLAEKLLGLGDFYRDDSIVASKDRSLAILVGVRERKAAYVWAAQVNAARRAGVREEAIGLFREQGLDAHVELLPSLGAVTALRDGAVDFVAGNSHSLLLAFPGFKGAKLLVTLSQGTPWLLV